MRPNDNDRPTLIPSRCLATLALISTLPRRAVLQTPHHPSCAILPLPSPPLRAVSPTLARAVSPSQRLWILSLSSFSCHLVCPHPLLLFVPSRRSCSPWHVRCPSSSHPHRAVARAPVPSCRLAHSSASCHLATLTIPRTTGRPALPHRHPTSTLPPCRVSHARCH